WVCLPTPPPVSEVGALAPTHTAPTPQLSFRASRPTFSYIREANVGLRSRGISFVVLAAPGFAPLYGDARRFVSAFGHDSTWIKTKLTYEDFGFIVLSRGSVH